MHIAEKKKYTEADYNLLEEGAPFQLINGDLIMSPAPIAYHQLLSIRLSSKIQNFLESSNSDGICLCAPIDVRLDDENTFQPDLIFISAERKTELFHNQIMGAPDLVIEILSPSTAYYDLRQKKDIYERFGVKEYLIIDPIAKDAELYLLENEVFTLKQKEAKNGFINLTTLPGLQIDLQKLFV
ncbi:MAG: Uma2 family endonuclease [Sphingobacteriaceae bacterium]|nr:MAG: Uma2 family endonuclease [Sphingobacteriaceae bacterium]